MNQIIKNAKEQAAVIGRLYDYIGSPPKEAQKDILDQAEDLSNATFALCKEAENLQEENNNLRELLKEAGRKCNNKNCNTPYCKDYDKLFPEQIIYLKTY